MDSGCREDQMLEGLVSRICQVYHLSRDAALLALRRSAFYPLLTDDKLSYCMDDAESNFRRYQNEVEFGAWNRNEFGGIVE